MPSRLRGVTVRWPAKAAWAAFCASRHADADPACRPPFLLKRGAPPWLPVVRWSSIEIQAIALPSRRIAFSPILFVDDRLRREDPCESAADDTTYSVFPASRLTT